MSVESPGALHGLRVLVVEDEALVSMLLEDMLADHGCEVAATASRIAQALELIQGGMTFDAADVVAGEYRLEVSSPGVDRPLTRLKDFAAYEGYEARLELDRLADNRKRFKGTLAGVEGADVLIDLEGEEDATAQIPFAWIHEAKLVLTDKLLKRGAELRAARLETEHAPDQEEDA